MGTLLGRITSLLFGDPCFNPCPTRFSFPPHLSAQPKRGENERIIPKEGNELGGGKGDNKGKGGDKIEDREGPIP